MTYLASELVPDQLHFPEGSAADHLYQPEVVGLHPLLSDLFGHVSICRVWISTVASAEPLGANPAPSDGRQAGYFKTTNLVSECMCKA